MNPSAPALGNFVICYAYYARTGMDLQVLLTGYSPVSDHSPLTYSPLTRWHLQRPACIENLLPGRLIHFDSIPDSLAAGFFFQLARHEDVRVGRNFFRAFDVIDEPLRLLIEFLLGHKESRAQNDGQHAVDDPSGARVAARATGQGAGQHFGDHR